MPRIELSCCANLFRSSLKRLRPLVEERQNSFSCTLKAQLQLDAFMKPDIYVCMAQTRFESSTRGSIQAEATLMVHSSRLSEHDS